MLARPELSQASLDLLAAADYMEEHGHCKGLIKDANGRVCLMGAIIYSLPPQERYGSRYSDADIKILKHLGSLAGWNNAPERTAQEVIDKLREVAYLPE